MLSSEQTTIQNLSASAAVTRLFLDLGKKYDGYSLSYTLEYSEDPGAIASNSPLDIIKSHELIDQKQIYLMVWACANTTNVAYPVERIGPFSVSGSPEDAVLYYG